MISRAPKIGFDRFIDQEWATIALQIRAGVATLEDLAAVVNSSHRGEAAKKKTWTVLKRLWLEPRDDLIDFADRGARLYRGVDGVSALTLTWGMAIAAYPFFGKVAEIVGRLSSLHGQCTSAEVQRRMAELFGEREGTRRMTNMVLQSQTSWGAIERESDGRTISRRPPSEVNDGRVLEWLAEACLLYVGHELSVSRLSAHPTMFPFKFGSTSSYSLSRSESLAIRTDGAGNHVFGVAYKRAS
ncbi:MAG: hypothetical protein EOS75_31270 [Mesorhizobium sp.]|nr:MAG: hypothetical protein EOS75_31270 [Mesorhizobium sp.]